ncbi:uncharacterized protein LOC131158634 [Malania oleifera]|uniref:uncharacterized protein LOC131158634 n=1 Tax=Malania oleifera TaxID=397392 RepID=UPI0025AE719B|nr:uncharacterized protein LOC131158634 [Malania oleifera]
MRKDPRGKNCLIVDQSCSIKEFMRLNPPTFEGGPDLMTAENWVRQIEEILEVLGYMDEQMVCYATFKMAGDAKLWWLFMKLLEEQRLVKIALTWDRFKELLFDRYFPLSIKEEKIEEFTNLTQGSMTVGEYITKFLELSLFASFLILNEARKARKFEKRHETKGL